MKEYVIKIDGQYWCGESDEVYGNVCSGGFFSMCLDGNKLHHLKLSDNIKDARKTVDPVSAIKNIFLKIRHFDKVEIESSS